MLPKLKFYSNHGLFCIDRKLRKRYEEKGNGENSYDSSGYSSDLEEKNIEEVKDSEVKTIIKPSIALDQSIANPSANEELSI